MKCCIFSVLILLGAPQIYCATFENVTILLTTTDFYYYINDKPPIRPVRIRSDDTLVEYVNNQVLSVVKIQNQTIPILPQDSVSNLSNVTELYIISSGVKEIQPGAFQNLTSLYFLYINGNPLEELSDGIFANLPILGWLHLQDNKISKLGNKVFNNLKGLYKVFLDRNRISTWKNDWFVGSPVGIVSISNNSIEELPKDMVNYYLKFQEEANYIRLIISNNKVKKIDPDAFRGLKNLGYIDMQNNSIEELPPGLFKTVKHINHLVLGGNLIQKFDVTEFFNNTDMTYLSLNNNKLRCFPADIFNGTQLYSLDITGNPLGCDCVNNWKIWDKDYNSIHRFIRIVSSDRLKKECVKN